MQLTRLSVAVTLICGLALATTSTATAAGGGDGPLVQEFKRYSPSTNREQVEKMHPGCTFEAKRRLLRCPVPGIGFSNSLGFQFMGDRLYSVRASFAAPGDWSKLVSMHRKVVEATRGAGDWFELSKPFSLDTTRDRLHRFPTRTNAVMFSTRDAAGKKGSLIGKVFGLVKDGKQMYGYQLIWLLDKRRP